MEKLLGKWCITTPGHAVSMKAYPDEQYAYSLTGEEGPDL